MASMTLAKRFGCNLPKFRTSPARIGQSAAKHVSRINDLRDLYARKIEIHVVSRLAPVRVFK